MFSERNSLFRVGPYVRKRVDLPLLFPWSSLKPDFESFKLSPKALGSTPVSLKKMDFRNYDYFFEHVCHMKPRYIIDGIPFW